MPLFGKRRKGNPSREDRLLAAVQAVLDRDFDGAEEILRELAEEDSGRIGPMLALGSLYRSRGEVGRAIRLHQNLLLRPDCSRRERVAALRGVAEDFDQGGFVQRAIAAYEELRQEAPRSAAVHRALTELYEKLRDYPRAITSRRRLARTATDVPSEAELYVAWAKLHASRGEADAASRALRKALRKDSENASAWFALGELEAEGGREKKARRAWERALALDARLARSILTKLEAASSDERQERALEELLAERVRSNPQDIDAALARVRLASRRGDQAVAIARLQEILKDHPRQLEALAWRARIVSAEGHGEEAAAAWDAVIDALAEEGRFERRGRLV